MTSDSIFMTHELVIDYALTDSARKLHNLYTNFKEKKPSRHHTHSTVRDSELVILPVRLNILRLAVQAYLGVILIFFFQWLDSHLGA